MKQMGFTMELAGGGKLCCLGDEPYNPACAAYVRGADWLLCEAFCLYEDRERFKPYEKHHSTVKDACELAQGWGFLIWCCGIRRTAALRSGRPSIRRRGAPTTTGTCMCPMTWTR